MNNFDIKIKYIIAVSLIVVIVFAWQWDKPPHIQSRINEINLKVKEGKADGWDTIRYNQLTSGDWARPIFLSSLVVVAARYSYKRKIKK